MKLLSYLAFLSCLEALVFAALAYWFNPSALLNRLGAVLGLVNAWWNACLVVVYGSPDLNTALVFDKLTYVAVLGITPLLAWFYLTFAEASNRLKAALLLPATAVVVVVAVAYVVGGFPHTAFRPGPWGNVAVTTPSLWTTVADITAVVLNAAYFVVLVRRRQTTPSWRLKRLISLTLGGIVGALAAYFVLQAVSASGGVPGLLFLPAAVVTLLLLYVMAQFRFLQKDTPRPEQGWAELLPQPAFLFDKQGRVVGTNSLARSLVDFSPPPFPASWAGSHSSACEVETSQGRLVLSPHFDRFGDFIGAVGLLEAVPRATELSPRENEVLALVVEGLGNQDIADKLFVSPGTVKRHVHSILAKMGARSRRELVVRLGKARV